MITRMDAAEAKRFVNMLLGNVSEKHQIQLFLKIPQNIRSRKFHLANYYAGLLSKKTDLQGSRVEGKKHAGIFETST